MSGQTVKLEGKIAVKRIMNDTCSIYSGDSIRKFVLVNSKEYSLCATTWLNGKDLLLGIEDYMSPSKGMIKSNLILLNTKGELVERIHESPIGECVGVAYPSLSDSLLVFTTRPTNQNSAYDFLYEPISISIINFNTRKSIRQLDNFCPSINFDIAESPWSPDEKHIVYCVSERRKSMMVGESPKVRKKPVDGIYIYDIEKDEHRSIAADGRNAIWSPKGDYIAYMVNNEIWLYSLAHAESKRLYRHALYEDIKDIHWTPDGEYVFVICTKYFLHLDIFASYNEKLIRVSDGKQVEFKKLNIGFVWYTWKK